MNKLVKLSDVVSISLGQTFREKAEAVENRDEIRLVQIKDIKPGVMKDIQTLPFADLTIEKLKVKLEKNDILLPLRGNRFSATLFSPIADDTIVTTVNHVAILRSLNKGLDIRYLLWFLNSEQGSYSISQLSANSAVQSFITRQNLSDFLVELPDKKTQGKIGDIYFNWLEQSEILNEMLINGNKILEKSCYNILQVQ
jgi:restriction endonuclease S subunit